ncbi:polyprenyl synthetase family protein [Streptococcus suis]|nr:polyprenyl synthetase family protein [Streptococcus suis]
MIQLEMIDQAIVQFYKENRPSISDELVEAILYSVQGGGKRIRPLLLLQVVEGFGRELSVAHYQIAAALEMIHTGSLIHDDLPAMDNDDYRRGRLTNHKRFDEATAILAGDSLFLDAFGLLATADLQSQVSIELVQLLSLSSGTFGMVGGQMLDMKGEHQELALLDLVKIHENKTGRLLTYPFYAAGIITEQPYSVLKILEQVGMLVGHAFQVRDDILDVTATFEELGKTPQKDVVSQKATYPHVLGLEQSKYVLNDSLDKAVAMIKELEEKHSFNGEQLYNMIESLRISD